MKLTIKQPVAITGGGFLLQDIGLEQIKIEQYAILSIDGSTTNTGMAILRECDGALLYLISAAREKDTESPVRYKVRLKQAVKFLFENNPRITTVYYEEPCIGFAGAVANLFMLRTFIEELIIENEPSFNHIKHYEIPNKRWKKLFLAPDKCPTGSEAEKAAVKQKVLYYMPFMFSSTQDEIDALAMGFAAVNHMRDGKLPEDLESAKKISKFLYNIQFIAADDDESMLLEFSEVYKGPQVILENGINLTEIDGKSNFDKHVYQTMGGDDKLLIIKFSTKHHSNLVLQHKIGHLAAQYDYLYAMVWRKSRKKVS